MAWLDFIKRIRQDEEEEEKRKREGGAGNAIFGFLDDVLDVGGRGIERAADVFQSDSRFDRERRLSRGLPEFYEDQQATRPDDVAVPFKRPDINDEERNFFEKVWDQLNTADNDRTFKNAEAKNSRSISSQARRNFNTGSASVARSSVGALQDASGLVDWLTPGEGTSRVTDFARETGKDIDEFVDKKGYSKGLYKTAQVPHQLAAFLIPGVVEGAAAAKIATMIPKGSKALTSAAQFTSYLDDVIKSGNKAEKAAAVTVKAATRGKNIANVGTDAAMGAGYRTSKGEDNSPLSFATDVALSAGTQGLLTGGAKVAGKALTPVKEKLIADGRIRPYNLTDPEVGALSAWRQVMGTGQSMNNNEVYDRARQAAAEAGVDATDADALDDVLGAFRTYDTRRAEREARGGIADRLLKPVSADYDPNAPMLARDISPVADDIAQAYRTPDELVDDVADSMFELDKGLRGGDMIPDAEGGYKRTSEHTPFYRSYYAANGRAPSREAYREAARQQLETGRGDFVDEDVVDAYGLLRSRAEETAALDQAMPVQQFQDIVARPTRQTSVDLQGGPGRQVQRGFLETVGEGETADKFTKKVVKSIEPQTYARQSQAPVMVAAKKEVEENYERALEYVKDPASVWDDRKSATLQQLAVKARNEGRESEFKDLLEQIDVEGRGAGRANAILAAWNRLSPDGVVQYAERQIKKFSEESGKGTLNKVSKARKGSPEKLADKIKDEVEKAGEVTDSQINDVIKRVASDEGEKTVGEKVAKNVESYMTPAKKKKADELVSELTKKIKQELIEKKAKTPGKSAQDVLREVFSRNKEALEALPEAQALLRERFKDNPRVLEQLDKMLNATLDMPAAKSTIGRAVKDVMKGQEAKISEIIKTSWASQKRSVDDITAALTKEGFDPASAKAIATEATEQLNRDIALAKKSVLDRLMQDAPQKAKATFEDKVARLSNLGALDDADYLAIAKKQLDLPDLDTATANKLSELAQKMQGLPDGAEKNQVIDDIMNTIADTMPPTAKEKFNAFRYQNLLSSPRTQLRNIFANTFNTLITRPAVLFTGAAGDVALSTVTRKPRERYLSEVPEYYKGLIKGFFDSHEAMGAAWRGTADITNPDLAEQFGKGGIERARMRNLPKKWTVVARLMEAQDKMFSGMIAGGEYAAQVKRGIPEEQAKKSAHELAEYSLLRQALDPKNATEQGTFLSAIDSVSQTLVDVTNKLPFGRWLVPFIRTPLNFGKQWLEFSPVGLANAGFGKGMSSDRRIEALNKGLLGTAVLGLGATLAADDRLTWQAPENEEDRQLFYAEGKKPYSVKIGDKWVPMITFGPFGLALGIAASAKHNFEDSPESMEGFEKNLVRTVTDLGDLMSQQTFLKGVSDTFAFLSGDPDTNLDKLGANTFSQMIPFNAFFRYVSTVVDPNYREAKELTDYVRRDIPGWSKGLPAQTGAFGEEIKRNVSDYIAPYSIGSEDTEPGVQANKKAYAEIGRAASRGGFGRNKVNDKITKALANGQDEEAFTLAEQHNTKVYGQMQKYIKSHKAELRRNPELIDRLVDEFSTKLINLNDRSIDTRLENQQEKREAYGIFNR